MDLLDRLPRARTRFASAVHRWFAVDARSLAAFRVALGLLVLADLLRRARYNEAFYTDAGVLPRSALLASSNPLHLSLTPSPATRGSRPSSSCSPAVSPPR